MAGLTSRVPVRDSRAGAPLGTQHLDISININIKFYKDKEPRNITHDDELCTQFLQSEIHVPAGLPSMRRERDRSSEGAAQKSDGMERRPAEEF